MNLWLPKLLNGLFYCLSVQKVLYISIKYKCSQLFCASRQRTLASFSLAALSANMSTVCFIYRFVSSTETRITQNSISQNYPAMEREIAGWKRLIVWNTADRLVLDHVLTSSPGFNKYSHVIKVLSGWSCHNLSGL